MASTADRGSGRGTLGTLTSPAPRRPRVGPLPLLPVVRTETELASCPDCEPASRPETDLREASRPDDRDDLLLVEARPERPMLRPEEARAAAEEAAIGVEASNPLGLTGARTPSVPAVLAAGLVVAPAAGARPQVSQ